MWRFVLLATLAARCALLAGAAAEERACHEADAEEASLLQNKQSSRSQKTPGPMALPAEGDDPALSGDNFDFSTSFSVGGEGGGDDDGDDDDISEEFKNLDDDLTPDESSATGSGSDEDVGDLVNEAEKDMENAKEEGDKAQAEADKIKDMLKEQQVCTKFPSCVSAGKTGNCCPNDSGDFDECCSA